MIAPIGGRRDALGQASGGRWTNTTTGQGGDIDTHTQTFFSASTQRLLAQEVDALLQFSAMARRIVWREPQDSLREGIDLGTPGHKAGEPGDLPDQVKQPILKALRDLKAMQHVMRARAWARAYGAGAIWVAVDDGAPDLREPVRWSTLRKIRALVTLDREEIRPVDSVMTRLGTPETYQIISGNLWLEVHRSRVIPFDGLDLPRRVRERNSDWWGGSILDVVYDGLRDWASAHGHAAEAIHLLTQGTLSVKNLSARLEGGQADQVAAELESLRMGMGLLGEMMIDPDRHTYEIHSRPLTGLAEGLAALNEYLTSLTDMPKTILMGQQPGGLNASADSEIRAWYDHCRIGQPEHYTPAFERLVEFVTRSVEGPTGGRAQDVKVVWPSLWQESEEVKTANRVRRAQARSVDVMARVITPAEARTDEDLLEIYEIDPDAPPPEPVEAPPAEQEIADDALPETPLDGMPPGESLITDQEAKARLGLGRYSMRLKRAHARGDLQAARMGGRWFFAWSQVVDACKRGLL